MSQITEKWFDWISRGIILFGGYVLSTAFVDFVFFLSFLESVWTIVLFYLFLSIGLGFGLLYFKASSIALNYLKDWKGIKKSEYLYIIPLIIITSPSILIVRIVESFWYVGGILIKKIIEVSGIFGKYLEASYKEYCPGIIWKKEND